jgi:predicted nucleic acid-binding protein
MKSYVVDANVIAAAFFQEPHANQARKVLTSGRQLMAPDLVYPELANVIWKRRRRNEIDAAEASQLLADFLSLPLRVVPSAELVDAALHLAMRTDRTVYDCLYLAMAIREKSIMVSGDRRLCNALAGGPLDAYITWIGQPA